MATDNENRRHEHIHAMQRLYKQRSFSDQELAERLETDRTNVFRIRKLMEEQMGIPIEPDPNQRGKYFIPKEFTISHIPLNRIEAVQLYLAGRRLQQQTRTSQRPVASALEKLAHALNSPLAERMVQAAEVVLAQEQDPQQEAIFATLVECWLDGIPVRITHRKLHGEARTYRVHPYQLEPSVWGDGVYLIGHSEYHGKLATFKMTRIEKAVKGTGTFTIPEDFDIHELLNHAWGVWHADEAPQTVTLRFSRFVTPRVRETIWHPQQTILVHDDGSSEWSAPVAEPKEMIPWVRGWGADVEVKEPDWLWKMLKREAQELAKLYRVVENGKELFAHFRESDRNRKEPQYLLDHLTEVSILAGKFAEKIGLKEAGEVLGLLHDLGKASKEFQSYILSGEGLLDPDSDDYVDAKAKKGKVDHSSAGAQVIWEKLWPRGPEARAAAQILALCLASHHSGLIDCLSPDGKNIFQIRMGKNEEQTHKAEALVNIDEINKRLEALLSTGIEQSVIERLRGLQEEKESKETLSFKHGLLIRFLFSCLIDADRLNTADFEYPSNFRIRNYGQYASWQILLERLNQKLLEFGNKDDKNVVDMLRNQVSQACLDFSTKPKGIYQLTVPTGGGKTLASLRFALNHAAYHSIDRIIYVIPFTSIIDQNADEVRKILEDRDANGNIGDNVVLEHHSNLTPNEETRRQSLLSQNWDAPIVFTTQVQFLESLFGSGTRGARRMHQLANSVIILDEVQTVPINCIHMLNVALRFLTHSCGATVLLCTATQPPLDKIESEFRALSLLPGQRIIPNEKELFEKLRRVSVIDQRKVGGWNDEEIAELVEQALRNKGSVLVIVNTKRSARSLFQTLDQKGIIDIYHLSTSMCPAHRLAKLNEVKQKLLDKQPVICISTQLIEAGVDIDFGSVIRYLAGMDSIAQAAGRCNRHGLQEQMGTVWIVNPKYENLQQLPDIQIGIEKTERLLDEFKSDPLSFDNDRIGLESMAAYYKHYFFERKDEMKYRFGPDSVIDRSDDLFSLLSTNIQSVDEHRRTNNQSLPGITFKQSFQTAAKSFRVIDSATQGVVVPFGNNGRAIVADLCGTFAPEERYRLLKKAQQYSVNLFPHEFRKLAEIGVIQEAQPGLGVFYLDERYYSDQFGWSDKPVRDLGLLTA
ncbi:MAG: CRISPR-associated helicase Cas3' [Caldilineaceae bacterium]|nr:CRISPR-associated helicase Cas3' [Caldilineaceae bacterium]